MKRRDQQNAAVYVRLPGDLLGLIRRDSDRARLSVSGWIRLKLVELYRDELDKIPPEPAPDYMTPAK